MSFSWFAAIWYCVFFISIIAYVVGDGFDLGVGLLYPFFRKERDKTLLLRSIAPFWDGNEVWLIIIFGGLFAGFPGVYAYLLSVFYMPVWLLVTGLIFRGSSLEFRNKVSAPLWKTIWDCCFFGSGVLIVLILGLFLGNLLVGFPFESGGLSLKVNFYRPYPILIGCFGLIVCAIQGGAYLLLKTEERIHCVLRKLLRPILGGFVLFYVAVTMISFLGFPETTANFFSYPYLVAVPILNTVIFLLLIVSFIQRHYGKMFFYSCMNIAFLILTALCSLIPYLLRCSDGTCGETFSHAAVEHKTLEVLIGIIIIGLPLVLLYNVFIYKTFHGKFEEPEDY